MLIATTVIAVIALGVWIYIDFIGCRKTRSWVKQIESAATDTQLLAAGKCQANHRYYSARGWRHLLLHKSREEAAKQKHEDAFLRQLRTQLNAETNPFDHAQLLLKYDWYGFLIKPAFGMTGEEVRAEFLADIDAIMPLVQSGDPLAMHDFAQIMDSTPLSQFCITHSVERPKFPSNWDDLVVERISSPTVKDFRNTPDLSAGEVRLLAAEALRISDKKRARKLAKLVLAYCLIEREVMGEYGYRDNGRSKQVINPYLIQVTDQLVSQLIVMVEAMENHTDYTQKIRMSKASE